MDLETARARANHSRYEPGQAGGFYESFFQRANHPTRPLAFWIRSTLFSPQGSPGDAIGELWAIYFDGEQQRHVGVKREVPFAECAFARDGFDVRVADAHLSDGALKGTAASGGAAVEWDLRFGGGGDPLFLLPLPLYDKPLPKAKALVGVPGAVYRGTLRVDGSEVEVDGWAGSQNHNWGTRHTDRYAWGQVAGFDGHPDSFLEVATGQLKLGPVWTPKMTPLVLRHGGREYTANALGRTARAKASWDYFDWTFDTEAEGVRISGRISAARDAFVGLRYLNPPGGDKHCLNTKIATAQLTLQHPDGRVERLHTDNRAAFEILTDERDHGIAIRA